MSTAGAEPFGEVAESSIRMKKMSLEKAVNGDGAGSDEILSLQASPPPGESGRDKGGCPRVRRVVEDVDGRTLIIIVVVAVMMMLMMMGCGQIMSLRMSLGGCRGSVPVL